ncbi:MAG: hypothetical protein K9H16_05580 [Bacteroidales bacterium]|nr:hypothetical protein [Bacteroidales bacterium]
MNIKGNFYHLWKFFSERQLRAHYAEHYKVEIDYYNNYQDKKPMHVMKKEMKILKAYWGCHPFQYIRYGMYKNSCKMSIEEMKDFIPNYFAYYLFFPKYFKEYGIVSDDKELTYRVLDSYGSNQPVLLLQYKNALFYDKRKNIISTTEADEIIKNSKAKKLFLKPTQGLGGRGIIVFNKKDDFVDKEQNILNSAFIHKALSSKDDYILQEGLEQHEELNNIYPQSVNTFRVMTGLKNGKATILFAMLRMGQGGNQLDNASQMGLVCKINPENGHFDRLGYTGLGKTLQKHPDTGFVFDGYIFPHWDEVRNFVITTAQKIDGIGYIGWDIAFTTQGPAVIEINAGAGLEFLQDSHGGVRKAYGIDDPKKYWKSSKFILKDF